MSDTAHGRQDQHARDSARLRCLHGSGRSRMVGATALICCLLLAFAATMSAGCAVVASKPATPQVEMPDGWQSAGAGIRAASAAAAPDLSSWWSLFDDATLSDLIEKALAANPDVRIAQTRVREARARRVLAGKDLAPTLSGSGSGSTSKTGGDAGGPARGLFDAAIDASWEPDIFGGTKSAIRASQADLQASRADLAQTHVTLVAELARTYVDLRVFQARLVIARDNLTRQEQTLQLTSWRAQAGLSSELDVEQARANVEQTRSLVPALDTGVSEAEHRLAVLVGLPPAALHATLSAEPGRVPAVPDQVAVGIPADTLRQRPDVLAAERRVFAETARLDQARAARYPTLRLSGSLGVQTVASAGTSVMQSVSSSLLAGLTAPIFDRRRIAQQIEIQSAAEERALVAYEGAVLTALEDAENALARLENAQRRQAALAAAATAARVAAKLARDQYTAGLVGYQTVLDTERSVLAAEDSLKSTEADAATSLISLYKALGGGWAAAPAGDAEARRPQ